MGVDIGAITEKVKQESVFVHKLISELTKIMVGQRYLLERLVVALLADGHVLVEGVPGLAKTTAVKTLAAAIDTDFQRIQFTPDLLPADLLGTQIYLPKTSEFIVKKGPIFSHIILADEINRAPAKVQSALLECMQERQVTIANETFMLEAPFLVMATQNPIEQEGTYPLPEAQVDRFMFKLKVSYPTKQEEREIMCRMAVRKKPIVTAVIKPGEILSAREVVDQVYIDAKIEDYIVDIVLATRNPEAHGLTNLKQLVEYGASPRASIYLNQAAKAHAFMQGRGYVTPHDVKSIGPDILRHRLILTYEAEAENVSPDDVINQIFDRIDVP
ncbi:MAG: MoxR family ATPase [Candidatus Schekmanbacteria bacterium]|nr:MoxR family ATPase [Candidatus Schekmanbacteria bacterium]